MVVYILRLPTHHPLLPKLPFRLLPPIVTRVWTPPLVGFLQPLPLRIPLTLGTPCQQCRPHNFPFLFLITIIVVGQRVTMIKHYPTNTEHLLTTPVLFQGPPRTILLTRSEGATFLIHIPPTLTIIIPSNTADPLPLRRSCLLGFPFRILTIHNTRRMDPRLRLQFHPQLRHNQDPQPHRTLTLIIPTNTLIHMRWLPASQRHTTPKSTLLHISFKITTLRMESSHIHHVTHPLSLWLRFKTSVTFVGWRIPATYNPTILLITSLNHNLSMTILLIIIQWALDTAHGRQKLCGKGW